jgi:hypothetical protein
MPNYNLISPYGPGTVEPIVLQRCADTGEPLFVLDEQPHDIPPQLIEQSKPLIARLGYRLIEVPTPDEVEADQEEHIESEVIQPEHIQEEPIEEEIPSRRQPPPSPIGMPEAAEHVASSTTNDDEKEEVS